MAVLHLLWWWLVVQVLWLIALPICLRVLRPLPDRGTSVAKAFGILVFVYPLWFFGSLGFLDNSRFSYTLVLVLLGALSVAIWRRSAADLRAFWWSHRRLLIVQEALFLAAYLGFGFVRMFNPEVVNTEKFMDFAFMSGAWRSESFPPLDPWFAGGTINYYYFGHLTVAILTRLSGLPLAETFNLTLALLFGLAALGAFGVAYNLVLVHRQFRTPSEPAPARQLGRAPPARSSRTAHGSGGGERLVAPARHDPGSDGNRAARRLLAVDRRQSARPTGHCCAIPATWAKTSGRAWAGTARASWSSKRVKRRCSRARDSR